MATPPYQAALVDASGRMTVPWREFFNSLSAAAPAAGSSSDPGAGIVGIGTDADPVGASVAEMMSFLPPPPAPSVPAVAPPAMPFVEALGGDDSGEALAALASFQPASAKPIALDGLTAGRVPFVATGAERLDDDAALNWDDANKRLGLGTTIPEQTLHVVGNPLFDQFAGTAGLIARSAGGALGAPAQTPALTTVFQLAGRGYTNAGAYTGNIIAVNGVAVAAPTAANQESRVDFRVIPVGTAALATVLQILGTGITTAFLASLQRIASPAQLSATVGTQNAFAVTSSFVRLGNATDTTINGIAAGVDGQEVTFASVGAGNVYFNHAAAAAAAGDKLATFFTVGSTPLAAGFGSATFRYDATLTVWRLIRHDQGDFISIPFASCVYDSNTGAFWTVLLAQVISQKFYIVGRTIFLHVTINASTTLAGVGARLRIDFSAYQPWSWLNTTRNWARVVDAGAAQNGMVSLSAATSIIQFSHDAADTAWAVGAGRTLDGVTVVGMLT